MQVTFNIDASLLKDTVEEIIKHMTLEEKKKLASDAVANYLTVLEKDEQSLKPAALPDFKSVNMRLYSRNRYQDLKDLTDAEILETEEFVKWWNIHKKEYSLRGYIQKELASNMLKAIKDEAANAVKNDERIQNLILAAANALKEEIPNIIQKTMTHYFANTMSNMLAQICSAQTSAMQSEDLVRQLQNKLMEKGIY